MFSKGKYVSFGHLNTMVCFPETLSHREMAALLSNHLGEPQSAGFFQVIGIGDGAKFEAYGGSTSLRLLSSDEDSSYMNSQFGCN